MTGPRNHRFASFSLFFFAILYGYPQAQKPAPVLSPGCGVLKGVTTCNWQAFRPLLTSSRVIAVEHGNLDRFTGKQLAGLIGRLGKTVASSGQPGNLTFVVVPANDHAISIGPADQPILDLRIYSGPTSQGDLLWVETFRGDLDRPWASSVHSVIDQFEDRVSRSR